MSIPTTVKSTTAGMLTLALSPLGVNQNQIDAGLAALWNEIEGRGVRSITNQEPLDRSLTPAQTAAVIGKSTKTVRDLCKRGKLRGIYGGPDGKRLTGISEESIRAFLQGSKAKGSEVTE